MAANISEQLSGLLYTPGKPVSLNLSIPLYIVCALGVPANVLCFFVLSRCEMRSSPMNSYLQFLAVFDSLFLSTWFFSLNGIGYPFIYYFTCMMMAGSVFTTVGVSMERFIAICYPLKAKTLLSYKRAILSNIFILISAVFSNVPRFFIKEEYSYGNTELILYYSSRFGSESFGQYVGNRDFDIAKYFVLVEIASLCVIQTLIAFCNVCIYIAVRKAEAKRRQMSQSGLKEMKLTKTVLTVVAVYFACWTPAMFYKLACYWGFVPRRVFYILLYSNYALCCLNSAANVIIYSAMRKDFRNIMVDMFARTRKIPDENVTPTTSL